MTPTPIAGDVDLVTQARALLAAELTAIDVSITALQEHRATIDAALTALAGTAPDPTDRAGGGTPIAPSPPANDRRSSAMRSFAATRVVCETCGQSFSAAGIGPHRRGCKKRTPATQPAEPAPLAPINGPWTPEPMSREPVDHEAVRLAAANAV